MAVRITTAPRGNRAKAFDREIAAIASELIDRQRAGIVTSRDLATSLNTDRVQKQNGSAWSYSVVDRMLRRGRTMGYPLVIRGRSQATSERRVHRRSKDEIARGRRRQ